MKHVLVSQSAFVSRAGCRCKWRVSVQYAFAHEPHRLSRREIATALAALHDDVDHRAKHLHLIHRNRLHCGRGCAGCCVDELTVFAVEADKIRAHSPDLLARGDPHAPGACAFLDDNGACRIYEVRPYVCRTQGLPLRWVEDDIEYRDICPLNESTVAAEALEALPSAQCWTLGPVEQQLAALQLGASTHAERVSLRGMFVRGARP